MVEILNVLQGALEPEMKAPEVNIPHWIKPESLLEEVFAKRKPLRLKEDNDDDFVFPKCCSDILTSESWQIAGLDTLKEELNKTKSLIDHLPLDPWHQHTRKMNIAGLIPVHIKQHFSPEFSSQAWGKMFEMLCEQDVIPDLVANEADEILEKGGADDKVPFDTVHLCEAPGAFISALNHYIKISYMNKVDWNWMATTLNPYHEGNDVGTMINDDRLIALSRSKWAFLADNTGNILHHINFKSLLKAKKEKLDNVRQNTSKEGVESRVLLVTADGSIDCQGNPSEQESMVAHLQYGEIIAALKLLSKGGNFVLKIFTFLEAPTVCHLYLLCCVFKQVNLFKPATSKEGNSEVYVVCLGYKGTESIDKDVGRKLVQNLENYGELLRKGTVLLSFSKIPSEFIYRILDAAQFFCNYQMKIIRRNLHSFSSNLKVYSFLAPFKNEAAEQWVEWSAIKPLDSQDKLFRCGTGDAIKFHRACHMDQRTNEGSFADKVKRQSASEEEKFSAIKEEIAKEDEQKTCEWKTLQMNGDHIQLQSSQFSQLELPYTNIRSSRFCFGRILFLREEVRQIGSKHKDIIYAQGLATLENLCLGHALKRVLESVEISGLDSHYVDYVCFNLMTWNFVTETDFQQQAVDLQKLIEAVKSVGTGRSIYLCRYLVLTRLQAGFLYCIASLFEQVTFIMNPSKNVAGILLYKFKGIGSGDTNLITDLTKVVMMLASNSAENILEVVPMAKLLDSFPAEFVLRYNLHILYRDITRFINIVGTLSAKKKRMLSCNDSMVDCANPNPTSRRKLVA